MQLPDFMSYRDRFSNNGFIEKISRIAKRAGIKLVYVALILYYTLESDKVSVRYLTMSRKKPNQNFPFGLTKTS